MNSDTVVRDRLVDHLPRIRAIINKITIKGDVIDEQYWLHIPDLNQGEYEIFVSFINVTKQSVAPLTFNNLKQKPIRQSIPLTKISVK